MPEQVDQGIRVLARRCPRCRSRRLRLYPRGGVAWIDRTAIRIDGEGVRRVERATAAVVGVPAIACTRPGCLWAAAASQRVAVEIMALGRAPGPGWVWEYWTGPLSSE